MARHLIVTVHGIGEQRPGETVDQIVAAATTDFPPGTHPVTGEATPALDHPPLVVERDLVELNERGAFTPEKRNASLFPVPIRRVRRAPSPDDGGDAVFAEVYWADKSPAPQGPFWTVFDLLKVVLGLGYLAMENAENTRGPIPVGLVHLFTWVVYWAIAPLNAALLIGSVLLLVDLTPLGIGSEIPVLLLLFAHAVVTAGLGSYIRYRVAKTYLVRLFGRGMMVFGAIILAVAVLGLFGLRFPDGACVAPDPLPERYFANLECFVGASIAVLSTFWLLSVLLAMLIALVALPLPSGLRRWLERVPGLHAQDPQDGVRGQRAIFPAICAAMVMFWMVFSSTFWLFFMNLTATFSSRADAHPHGPDSLLHAMFSRNLSTALGSLSATAACMFVVLVATGVVLFFRTRGKEAIHMGDHPVRDRLILNIAVQAFLLLSLAVIFLAVVDLFLIRLGEPEDSLGRVPFLSPALDALREYDALIATILLGLGLAMYNFSDVVASALGVVRDIVTYATQDHCEWRSGRQVRHENFRARNEINDRFRLVMEHAVETYRPERVTVLSHSQGTVVATQMLQDGDLKDYLARHGADRVRLVTMGSPVTHIYRQYFPEFFQVSRDRLPGGLAPGERWFNIFRRDDFVGTRIDPDVLPDANNLDVPAGGHTGYFTDYHVWARLWHAAGFRLFCDGTGQPPPVSRASASPR